MAKATVGQSDARTDGQTKEWSHGQIVRRTDNRTDGRMDGQPVCQNGGLLRAQVVDE